MLKIVLTGGPCAGKSEALSRLTQSLEERGYKVITVPEAATHMILNGIRPCNEINMDEFQDFVIATQIANEDIFNMTADYFDKDKLIVFYDRGIMDGCAYTDKDTVFKKLLEKRNMTFADVFNRYDAVLHLVTAAKGAEKYYQWNDPSKPDTGNNAARRESPEEAVIADDKTMNSWIGHPHLRVFDNSTDFDGKLRRIVEEVFALLGAPVPKEVERKFLIKKPTAEQIAALGCMSQTNIIQTYLKKGNNVAERRVRQRGTKETGFTFYYTEKTDIASGVRVEDERKISPDEYLQYLTEADTTLHQISKIRHCFVYDNQYFEMDMYPFSEEYAILEIELNDINEPINFPPLSFVREVTDDKRFRNYFLASRMSLDPGVDIGGEPPVVNDNFLAEGFFSVAGDLEQPKVEYPPQVGTWVYETGRDEPEILGSGSHHYDVVKTTNEETAIRLSKEGARNYLHRSRKVNGETEYQWYDYKKKEWYS